MKKIFGAVVPPGTTSELKKDGWRVFRPEFKQDACIGCQNCLNFCPEGAVYKIDKKKYQSDTDACKGCGICAEMCPENDIEMVVEGGETDGVSTD